MRPFLRRLLRFLSGLFILLVAAGLWLTGTASGLSMLLDLAGTGAREISAREIRGSLLDGARLADLVVRQPGTTVQIEQLQVRCNCAVLFLGIVELTELSASGVHVQREAAVDREEGPPAAPALPLVLRIPQLDAREVHVNGTLRVRRLIAAVEGSPLGVAVRDLDAALPGARLRYAGVARIGANWRIDADARWDAAFADRFTAYGSLDAEGNADQLAAKIIVEAPVESRLNADVRDLFGRRTWTAKLDAPWSGLRRLSEELPPDLAGRMALQAQGTAMAWSGTGEAALRRPVDGGDVQTARVEFSGQSLASDPARGHLTARWQEQGWQSAALDLSGVTGDLTISNEDGLPAAVLQSRFAAGGENGRLDLEAVRETESIHVRRGELVLGAGRLETNGRIFTGEIAPRADLRAAWENLTWRSQGFGALNLQRGSAALQGSLEAWSATLQGHFTGERVPETALNMTASGSDTTARIEALQVEALGGRLEGEGRMQWAPGQEAALTFRLQDLDPGIRWPRWRGRIGASGDASWAPGTLTVRADLDGQLRGNELQGGVNVTQANGRLAVKEFLLQAGTAELQIRGSAGETLDLDWRLEAPRLAVLHPDATGDLRGQGTLGGSRDAPVVQGTLRGTAIRTPWADAEELFLDIDFDPDGHTMVDLSGTGLGAGDRRVERLGFQLDGTRADHRFELEARADPGQLRLQGTGAASEERWDGSLHDLSLDSRRLGQWALEAPMPIRYEDGTLALDEACIARDAARLCPRLEYHRATDRWSTGLRADGMPIDMLDPLAPPSVSVHGTWELDAAAQGIAGRVTEADGTIVTRNAGLRLDIREREPYAVQVTEGDGRFSLADGVLTSELGLRFDDAALEPFTMNLTLAPISGWPLVPEDVRVTGSLTGGLRGLGFVAAASPLLEDVTGTLALDVSVDGTLAAPFPQGGFSLADGGFRLPDLGTAVRDVTLSGRDEGRDAMRLTGAMRSGTGTLRIDGRLSDLHEAPAAGATVSGERFELVNLPELWALISPQLELEMQRDGGRATGKVLVPEARINLDEVVVAPSLSEDVVVKGDETKDAEQHGGRFGAGIEIELGEKVEITGRGVKGRLAGNLRIDAAPGSKPLADGEIRIVDGSYSAYGQSLQIREGRIIYTRAELDNPQLDVQAARTVGDVTAGVAITGRLTNPRISLFSSPSMSQEQILAYVVLGRPLSQVGAGESKGLVDAATSMGLQNSGFLTSRLSSTFGLDTVSVETEGTADTASLVVGKYLSPRLYLSYGFGVFQALSTARLRYDLTDSWALQAESSEEVGVDLFYKIHSGIP